VERWLNGSASWQKCNRLGLESGSIPRPRQTLAVPLRLANGDGQRIWINNRSPHSTFCRWKLLQILSPCVLSALPTPPPPPATADHPPPASCFPFPRHTGREDLEQFQTTENLAWASVTNSYSLGTAQHRELTSKDRQRHRKYTKKYSAGKRFFVQIRGRIQRSRSSTARSVIEQCLVKAGYEPCLRTGFFREIFLFQRHSVSIMAQSVID
jgi:hypothetical protein